MKQGHKDNIVPLDVCWIIKRYMTQGQIQFGCTRNHLRPMLGEWHHKLSFHSAVSPNPVSVCFPGSWSHSHKTLGSTTRQQKSTWFSEHIHLIHQSKQNMSTHTGPDSLKNVLSGRYVHVLLLSWIMSTLSMSYWLRHDENYKCKVAADLKNHQRP